MATLDLQREALVIRVVYDGSPFSGKTTSLRALAGSLSRPLASPEEVQGRTLLFDWMDYTAGRFEGYPIRCQVVSVPGQRSIAARRHRLLAQADVVVLVADTTAPRMSETLAQLEDLEGFLRTLPGPPVGIVVQANKRDLPEAVPLEALRQRIEHRGVAFVETTATTGSGVLHSFIFAVRLALDRVRQMIQSDSLPQGSPEIDSAEDLLDDFRRWEGTEEGGDRDPRSHDSLAAAGFREALAEGPLSPPAWAPDEPAPNPADPIQPPAPDAPIGMIWPPVEGRILLRQALSTPFAPHRTEAGDWEARIGDRWRVYSPAAAEHSDVEEGRKVLLYWARVHAAHARWLSPDRCLTLSPTGFGSFRLWQVVRITASCGDRLRDALRQPSPEELARCLLLLASSLLQATSRFAEAEISFPSTLDTVGLSGGRTVYIGLLPPALLAPEAAAPPSAAVPLIEQLQPEIERAHAERPLDVPRILNALSQTTLPPGHGADLQEVVESVCRLLLDL